MAEADIDKLQIELSADSKAASTNIDKLAKSLGRLEKSIGTSGTRPPGVSRAGRELRVAASTRSPHPSPSCRRAWTGCRPPCSA